MALAAVNSSIEIAVIDDDLVAGGAAGIAEAAEHIKRDIAEHDSDPVIRGVSASGGSVAAGNRTRNIAVRYGDIVILGSS
jgi:hypothetical protein